MDLTRRLAHEIQAPLTSLELQLRKLLTEAPDNATASSCLDEVSSLKRLVSSLLDLQEPELKPSALSLEPLLERLRRRFLPLAAERNVTLEWSSTAPTAFADALATERILTTLLDNAIKFSRNPGSVRVVAMRVDAHVELHVRDDGIGIAPEALDAVFEPFYRVDREIAGHGLGLTIARRLADAQRATLSCESEPGRGSSFILTLPAT